MPAPKENLGPLAEQTSESYAGMFDTNVLGTLLSLKHELRVHAAAGLRQHHQYFFDHGRARCGEFSALHRKQARGGRVSRNPPLSKPPLWAWRVNAVAPGPTETAMLDRLTGTPDKKKRRSMLPYRLSAGAKPERDSRTLSCSSLQTKRPFVTGQIIRIKRRQKPPCDRSRQADAAGIFIFRPSEPDHDHRQPPGIRKRVDSLRPTPDQHAVHMQCISSEE